jgi:DNA-directed RNA polymerase subunit delta
MNQHDSLLEIALREMKSKRKPRTLAKITKDVFEVKGINPDDNPEMLTQFHMDFMLSGHFICIGEDKHGVKLWDLKNRQPSTLLDKDGSYLEDLYDYDDEVAKYELKDDIPYQEEDNLDDDDDDDNDLEESDDIEEELFNQSEDEEDEEEEDDFVIDVLDDEEDDEDEDEDY